MEKICISFISLLVVFILQNARSSNSCTTALYGWYNSSIDYLNSSAYDDPHEEIWDNTSNGHHEALNDSDTRVEAQNEEKIMHETRMKMDHEVANSSGDKCNHHQKWHC